MNVTQTIYFRDADRYLTGPFLGVQIWFLVPFLEI